MKSITFTLTVFVWALGFFSIFSCKAGTNIEIFANSFEQASSNTQCTLTISPGTSFINSFAGLVAGDTLCLNDGTYQQAMDIPSDIHVRAVHDGMAEIDGGDVLGEAWTGGLLQMKGNNSSVRGLRVHDAAATANTCHIGGSNNTMQVMSCAHGGSHKHKIPVFITGSGHLIEDSWAFGEGRYVVQCFVGRDITIRRTVARWDSTVLFDSNGNSTSSEPNAAFSIYNCSDITIENNISLDYGPTEQVMRFGADFYSPQNCSVWPEGNNNNHYLGNYVINHVETSVFNQNRKGLRFEADCTAMNNVVKDFYVRDSDYGIVIGANETGLMLENCSFENILISNINGGGANASASCVGAADIGAQYMNRVKINNNLFPWPHQNLIKRDMCQVGERQSDWCLTTDSLSDYVLSGIMSMQSNEQKSKK